jgi:Rieske Fe-S protein
VATQGGDPKPHSPLPSLWPVGFALGIVCILVGLVVSWPAVAAGAVIAIVFGLLWAREATSEYRTPVQVEPEHGERAPAAEPLPATAGEAAMPEPEPGEIERYPRSKFLEFSTLGLGAAIGAVVTVPVAAFAVVPTFVDQEQDTIDLGPLENFPESQYMIVTFFLKPEEGEVSRRTAYIRYNGQLNGLPSFTIVSNRCVHLGCPVQPNGPIDEEGTKKVRTDTGEVTIIPMRPAGGFGCPCHGGSYNTEGDRISGPPVRALDRYEYGIDEGRLVLLGTYSVAEVEGTGATAKIKKYGLQGPGEHVDGPEAWLYPLQPSDISS